MPRTDEQISEYMKHYRGTTDKYQALEALARVEGKTETEIIEICEKHGVKIKSKWGGTRPTLSEEKREEVRAAIREGLTLTEVAERCGVGASTAGRIRVEMTEHGEKLPKNVGGHKATAKYKAREAEKAEQRQPEAYPGQIYDDGEAPASDPIVEEDVKVFIPGEQQEEPESGTARACTQPSLWFALRDSLSEFLSGTFGAGTEKIGECVSAKNKKVAIGIRTVDGAVFRCTLIAEDDDE